MDYEVELDAGAGRDQEAESLVVRFEDGREERMRLHEYDRVYAIPGLYSVAATSATTWPTWTRVTMRSSSGASASVTGC